MKKNFKRIAALLLTVIMAIGMFTACGKESGSAASMFDVVKTATELEKYSFESTITADVEGTNVEIVLSGESDGKATAVSAKASMSGMSYEFKDLFVFTDDVLYIHLGAVTEELSAVLSLYNIDLASYGLDMEWIAFECKGAFDKDTTFINKMLSDMDKAYSGMVEKKDGNYSITIDDEESYKKFVEETKTMIETNGDAWAELIKKQADKLDVEEMVNTVVDDIINAMVEVYKEAGYDVTDDMKAELKDQLMDEVDLSDASVSTGDITDMFDELTDELDSAKDAYEDFDGTVMTFTTGKDKGTYTVSGKAEVTGDEEGTIDFTTKITADSKASVDVPADATPFADVLTAVLKIAAQSGMLE